MAERINCCPVCMCRHRVSLTASGSEYASLIIPAKGQEALFKKLMYRDGIRIIPEVITTGDMFAKGELGWEGDVKYRSKKDANVYPPSVRPEDWEEVE